VLEKYEAVFTEVPDAVEVMDWSSLATAQLALKVIDDSPMTSEYLEGAESCSVAP
jgi:hypothetical protein